MSAGGGRVRASLRRTLAMARKELRQLQRDRLTLAMIIGIPTLQLVLFGYAINLDVRHIPTAVLDRAQSELSRKTVGELAATQTFAIERAVGSEREGIALLANGEVGAVVLIPRDFDRDLHRGHGAEISILADASNPTVASAVALAGQGFGQALAARMQPFVSSERQRRRAARAGRTLGLRPDVRARARRADPRRGAALLQPRAPHAGLHRARVWSA